MDIIDYGQKNSQINKGTLCSDLSVRIEKLTTAVYMVTDCLEDDEPIKNRLRLIGVNLVTLGLTSKSENKTISHNSCVEIGILTEEARSLISIAGLVGLIGEMNSSILKIELERIAKMASNVISDHSINTSITQKTGVILSEDFFDTQSNINKANDFYKGQMSYKGQENNMSFINKSQSNLLINSSVPTETRIKKFSVAEKINRTNSILKFIKDKGEVSIKDITIVISDCSEKTVQRELGVLVEQRVIKRSGEKRWSKYQIA